MAVYEWGETLDQTAVKKVNDNLTKIAELYAECEQIARKHNFDFGYKGPAGYGDGGSFYPSLTEDNWGNASNGWLASSQSC